MNCQYGVSAHDVVGDLVEAGYVVKDKDGRRNRYRIQQHLLLDLLVGVNNRSTHGAQDATRRPRA